MDEVTSFIQEARFTICEVSRDLAHPLAVGLAKNPGDIDSTSLEVDDEQNEISNQARSRKHFDAEEICRSDDSPMRLQERIPRHPPFSGWGESVFEKDPLDGIATDLVPEVVESSSDSRVAPTRIISGHHQNQILDVDRGLRSAGTPVLAPIILARDQPTIPAEQGIRGHQGLYLEEPSSADPLGHYGESAALVIGKPESLSGQLRAQDSVFLLEILDHILLVSIDPDSEDQHQKLQRQSVHQAELRPAKPEKMG